MTDVKSRSFVGLLLVAALGCAMRIYGIDARSLWLDEAWALVYASQSISAIATNSGIWEELTPPLYYLLLHVWIELFGTSELAVRFLSVIFGTFAIVLTGFLGFFLYDRRTGLLAALVLAIMVFPIYHSQEARTYSLFLALSVGSFYLCLKSLERNSKKDWIAYIVVTLALLYSHNYWVFLLLAQNIYVLLFYRREKPILLHWIVAQAAVFLFFFPWLIALLKQTKYVMHASSWWHIPRPWLPDLVNALRSYVAYLVHPRILWGYLLLCVLGTLPPKIWVKAWQRGKGQQAQESFDVLSKADQIRRNTLLILWLVLPVLVPFIVSQFFTPIFSFRYTIGAVPALYLLVARGVSQVPTTVFRGLVISAILVISFMSLRNYHDFFRKEVTSYQEHYFRYPVEPWREWVAFLNQHVEPTDTIVVSPDYYSHSFNYYSRGAVAYYTFPSPVGEEGTRLRSKLDMITNGKKRLWLVFLGPTTQKGSSLEFFTSRYAPVAVVESVKPKGSFTVVALDLTQPRRGFEH